MSKNIPRREVYHLINGAMAARENPGAKRVESAGGPLEVDTDGTATTVTSKSGLYQATFFAKDDLPKEKT